MPRATWSYWMPVSLAQRLQLRAAVAAQALQPRGVLLEALCRAVAQELQPPAPLRRVGAQAKQQRRVFLRHPFQRLQRDAGLGPGRRMVGRDLAAVGEAGFQARPFAPVQDLHVVAGLAQVPGRGDADHAGPQDGRQLLI